MLRLESRRISTPVAVIGAGSFETCLATERHDVTTRARDPDVAAAIEPDRRNPRDPTDVEMPRRARVMFEAAERVHPEATALLTPSFA